jgi:hypothetical protein
MFAFSLEMATGLPPSATLVCLKRGLWGKKSQPNATGEGTRKKITVAIALLVGLGVGTSAHATSVTFSSFVASSDILAAEAQTSTIAFNYTGTGFVWDGSDWTIAYNAYDIVLDGVSPTPEPSSIMLLSTGCCTPAKVGRRRNQPSSGGLR